MRKEKQLSLFFIADQELIIDKEPVATQPKTTPITTSLVKKTIVTSSTIQDKATTTSSWKVYIDGASRGNPGKAGVGMLCIDSSNKTIFKKGFYLGERTNNQAEYAALVIAAALVVKHSTLHSKSINVTFISDSELLVRQMSGIYKIKNDRLKQLKEVAEKILHAIPYSFKHVLRAYNKQADELANKGVDAKTKIPTELLAILAEHNITL